MRVLKVNSNEDAYLQELDKLRVMFELTYNESDFE